MFGGGGSWLKLPHSLRPGVKKILTAGDKLEKH